MIWAEGYVMIPRALFRSAMWHALTAEQRSVVVALWALANFRAGGFQYGSERIDVGRGELAHSLAGIAEQAAVSIKVVRTTLRRLQAGSPSDGIGPLAGTRRGTTSGRGPRIVSLLQYEPSRPGADAPGTVKGKASGTAGARPGHNRGTERIRESGNQGRRGRNASTRKPVGSAPASRPEKFLDGGDHAFP